MTQIGLGPKFQKIISSLEQARPSLESHTNDYSSFLRSAKSGQLVSENEADDEAMGHAFEPFLQLISPGLDKKSQQAAVVLKLNQR